MPKVKKIIFALILSIIITSVGSVAEVSPAMAEDSIFDDFYDDSFFDDDDPPFGRRIQNSHGKDNNGLKAEYYSNLEFKGYKITRVDPRISFDWGTGSPTWIMNHDKFSVRWIGQLEPAYSEQYTFHAITDDGVRLWVNNQLIIDQWKNRAATEYEGTIRLMANKKYNIRMEYFEYKDDACAKLLWSSKSQEKEIIPKNRLFPVTGTAAEPTRTPAPTPTSTPAPSASVTPISVDLTDYFDQDAFSYDTDRSDGDYDGANNTYPADLADRSNEYDYVPFHLGSFANGRNNAVVCDGQIISFDRGKYASIRLAGTATNGNKTGVFKINYTDGTYSSVSITMKDWCTLDTSGEKILQKMEHRHSATSDNSTDCCIFVYYLTADRNKTVKSITLPDQNNMHILAVTLVPYGSIVPAPETGNGLKADYFDNMDLTDSSLVRIDSSVNFDWGTSSPDKNIGPNTFSVRWTGQVMPQYTQTYTFYTVSDDGVRLWVNNKLLIDDWVEQSATENSGSIALQAGQKYNIKLEYFEKTDNASIKLSWSSPSRSRQIIPESRLFH